MNFSSVSVLLKNVQTTYSNGEMEWRLLIPGTPEHVAKARWRREKGAVASEGAHKYK